MRSLLVVTGPKSVADAGLNDLAYVPGLGHGFCHFHAVLGLISGHGGVGAAVAALDVQSPAALVKHDAGAAADGAVKQFEQFKFILIIMINNVLLN